MKRTVALIAVAALVGGCYTATIDTGRKPSTKVIKQAFASCWIYGLIPPKTVETATECPNGIAQVMTRHSFVNQLVGMLTFGIYTPMEITVTCAESGSVGDLGPDATVVVCKTGANEDIQKAFAQAADKSVELGRPVYVQFTHDDAQLPQLAAPVSQ